MPNWCYSDINITAPKEEIKILAEKFEEAFHIRSESDFDKWLGNLLIHLGYSEEDAAKGDIRCRGSINYFEVAAEQIFMGVESAWSPHMRPIMMMVEKYAPNAEIIYTSEEPGNGLFISNDPDIYGKLAVDFWDPPKGIEGGAITKDELKDMLEEYYGEKCGLINLIQKANSDFGISVNKYEYCPIEEATV